MFSIEELAPCLDHEWLRSGHSRLEEDLLRVRLGIQSRVERVVDPAVASFARAVLSSVDLWDVSAWRQSLTLRVCSIAADIELALALRPLDRLRRDRHALAAAILYDLAKAPSMAAAVGLQLTSLPSSLRDFFARTRGSLWGTLMAASLGSDTAVPSEPTNGNARFADALEDVLRTNSLALQGFTGRAAAEGRLGLRLLAQVCGQRATSLDRTEVAALGAALLTRRRHGTCRLLRNVTAIGDEGLRTLGASPELWPPQRHALHDGLLDDSLQSFGLAAAAGTGKTSLARLLLADFLARHPDKVAVYVTPSRALTAQVAADLRASLGGLGWRVLALGGDLAIDETLTPLQDCQVLVFTPEKADLLLRISPELIERVGLVVVDEAHHVEQGTRGMLLEFYLWRLRALVPPECRVVQLSAVAPNIDELVAWLGVPESTRSVRSNWRPNPLRLGTLERLDNGMGALTFPNLPPQPLLLEGDMPTKALEGLAAAAVALSRSGVVLVLCTSPKVAEAVATLIWERRSEVPPASGADYDRLDARIERELYADCPLRQLLGRRVAYHHARLPPRVRSALERLIAGKQVDIVCATTTLAEGVNFPFSTVLVESLVGRGYELSPRALWNIAGRAGRFGVDLEGHCILFRPSLWKKKLKEHPLEEYFVAKLSEVPQVRSALALGLEELRGLVLEGTVGFPLLQEIDLEHLGGVAGRGPALKRARGLVNVMRVAYAHARVSGVLRRPSGDDPSFPANLLATRQMTPQTLSFARRLGRQQRDVVERALERDEERLRIAAKIGWSLETQSQLHNWLTELPDWRLEQFGHIVVGGEVRRPDRLGYLIGPLSSKMAEFEGDKLGGFTAYVSTMWIEGLPLTMIQKAQTKKTDWSRLIEVIYARVQYMLPWALFGLHELLQLEARHRGIAVGSGVRDLSLLASEGVSSFDALTLVVQLGVERVDATRLASAYRRTRPRTTDVAGWIGGQPWAEIRDVVQGVDHRRLDPDLRTIHDGTQNALRDRS